MSINTCESFEGFMNEWLVRHRQFVEQLVRASSPDNTVPMVWEEQTSLVKQFLSHCLQYYEAKSSAAVEGDNVFVFFSPPWLTSYEKTLTWVGGFKPSLAFKLIEISVQDLTRHQKKRIRRIRCKTVKKESDLTVVFAQVQERIADEKMMAAAEAIEELKVNMAAALNAADELRCSTVGDVIEVLTPPQAIRFLRSAGELHLRIRELGLQRRA